MGQVIRLKLNKFHYTNNNEFFNCFHYVDSAQNFQIKSWFKGKQIL